MEKEVEVEPQIELSDREKRREDRKLDRENKVVDSTSEVKPEEKIDYEKELKSLQRQLKREQRASKTAESFEKELQMQKKALDDVINSHMIYLVTDEQLIVKSVSQAFCDHFGYEEANIIGKSYGQLVAQQDSEKFYIGCEYVSTHGKESWGTDIRMIKNDFNQITTHSFIYPTFEAHVMNGFTFVLNDITSEKSLHSLQVKMFKNEKLDKSMLEFVSSTSAAVLDTVSNKISSIVKIIVGFVIFVIIYATSFEIDELSRGGGQFIPTSKIQHVKNLEGGIISEIFVHEGDSIKKGQKLMKLNPIAHQVRLDENNIRIMELLAKEARLKAETLGEPLDTIICDVNCDLALIQREETYYKSNQKELRKNISKQEEQLKSKKSSLKDAIKTFEIKEQNYRSLLKDFKVKKSLEQKKVFTKFEMAILKRELNDAKSKLGNAKELIIQVESQIQEVKEGIELTKVNFINTASLALNETLGEILRLEEQKKTIVDIIDRAVVLSPVNGIVKELFFHTIGTSVQPSAELMTIVPDNFKMVAEIKMKPEEIAKLHIGQDVKIKVTAFDYSIYGDLDGKITHISPDTIVDKETGTSYYMIYVKTDKNYLNNNEKYQIKVGMMVNADILVGKKSMMAFILKPILKTTQRF